MKIKICGMKEPENIREVAALEPDYMGFIFYRASRRYAGRLSAGDMPGAAGVKRIGVFVDESVPEIKAQVRKYGLDGVQLHGGESPVYCRQLADAGIAVIKAFGVDAGFDFNRIAAYKGACRYVLFDTKTDGRGGSGRKFDWLLLQRYDQNLPFFLSGGIGEDDIAGIRALRDMNLHALDLNSRFETAPGIKNVEKLNAFMQRLREPGTTTIHHEQPLNNH